MITAQENWNHPDAIARTKMLFQSSAAGHVPVEDAHLADRHDARSTADITSSHRSERKPGQGS